MGAISNTVVSTRLKGLLLTADADVLSVMRQVLDHFIVETEVCPDVPSAYEKLTNMHLDLVIMDWIEHKSVKFLQTIRSSAENAKSTVLAIVSGDLDMLTATNSGANLTIYKPLKTDQATRLFRAAYGNMLLQRRRVARCPVNIPVVACLGGVQPIEGLIIDLSVQGMAFRSTQEIRMNQNLSIEFKLPETSTTLHVNGRITNVITSDTGTRVGISFSSLPLHELALLERWIAHRLPKLPIR